MAHFAKLGKSNIIEAVVVVNDNDAPTEQAGVDFLNNIYNTKDIWKQTSYNTKGGVHLLGGTPFRKNYAEIGGTYDSDNQAFMGPKPYGSWVLNKTTYIWESPVAKPSDDNHYFWDETIRNWVAEE